MFHTSLSDSPPCHRRNAEAAPSPPTQTGLEACRIQAPPPAPLPPPGRRCLMPSGKQLLSACQASVQQEGVSFRSRCVHPAENFRLCGLWVPLLAEPGRPGAGHPQHADIVVVHRAGLAVHDAAGRPDDGAAEDLADALVPHAHAQQRKVGAQLPDNLQRYAAVLRAPYGKDARKRISAPPDRKSREDSTAV